VDGIPLAIELAAARVRVLSPAEIVDGLDDHLRLLRGGHRPDPRHQTIRASLDWSHGLLTDSERQLFARLSVFAGGFDLQAAAAVCAGGGIVSDRVLDEVEGLVDKSLLVVERGAAATRFRMLDFVRQYAAERLAAAGEDAMLADRHRAYFRELAERADRELWALAPPAAHGSMLSRPTWGRPSTMAVTGRQPMPWPWQGRWACTGGCGGEARRVRR
jgi:non-specific serine/threonine protein kinase